MLNCRLPGGRDPIRVICDSRLRTPLTARVVATAGELPTILATCETDPDKHAPYQAAGCRVLPLPADPAGRVDLAALLDALGAEEVDSLLLEGGAALNWSALEGELVQAVYAYIAPKLLGGATAKSPVAGTGVPDPEAAFFLKNTRIQTLGEDILLESEVEYRVHGHR